MKWYHFGMLFAVLFAGSVIILQTIVVQEQRMQEITRTEYDCLTAAVEAATYVAFEEAGGQLSLPVLEQTEEIFFQTLSVLRMGITDAAGRKEIERYVPCIFVFGEQSCYGYIDGTWEKLGESDDGILPEQFYRTAEDCVNGYLRETGSSIRKIRMEAASQGIWEKGLKKKGIFAVYVPVIYTGTKQERVLLYGAAHVADEVYLVTEDGCCHLPGCEQYKPEEITERYTTQRESAENGAIPCEWCLQP